MNTYEISELKPNTYFNKPLMLDKSFLLVMPPSPLTGEQIRALKEWNFTQVYTEGKISIAQTAEAEAVQNKKSAVSDPAKKAVLGKTESVDLSEYLDESDDRLTVPPPQKPEPKPTVTEEPEIPVKKENAFALAQENINHKIMAEADDKKKFEIVQAVYKEYMTYINAMFTRYATHKELNIKEISETVGELCTFVRENTRYILRISPSYEARNKNFLVTHSMRSTVLAITIGLQLNMNADKLIELGVAGILHELGQIRLPPQLYMNDKPLTPMEKSQMMTHTILGFNILKEANFPLSIQLGVLDHHERETGTGYPRHLTGENISLYGKIIAVACSFEAITTPRHYKEAKTTYEAMIELLRNENHQYDDTVVKALLYSMSLYPIGAYVYLANGKAAQVTDVTPGNPRNPVVQIMGEEDADGNPITVQTNETNLKILRQMNEKESADLIAALKTIKK